LRRLEIQSPEGCSQHARSGKGCRIPPLPRRRSPVRRQRIEEITPKKINGEWVQQWQVINVGTDDRNALVLREWERLREMRNNKLSNTDWTQLADSPVDKSGWASYRQALRDLPLVTQNPFEVVWPEEPE
jgi:hypothetical protein